MEFYLPINQDLSQWATIIFICCVMVVVSVLFDLQTGVSAAKKQHEQIKSKNLRRTIAKILDYLRVVCFGLMIDVLGINFDWYRLPFCVLVVTLGVILIEAKSVLENYHKSKSAAAMLPDMLTRIIQAATEEDAIKLIKEIKSNTKK